MNVLLSSKDLLSRRHLGSMLMLAAGAGAVNAGALLACDRFVSHVTGTATRIGVDAPQPWLMLEYALVLVAFIAGAMASVLFIQGRVIAGKQPLHAVPLFGAAAGVLLTAVLGASDAFGALGGPVEQSGDFAMLSLLAFSMGLMNAGVASSTALAVRTTHMTGPATDFGVSLATALLSSGEPRREAFRLAALRGGKVLAFIGGGALMAPLVARLGFAAFVVPAMVLLVAAARSFLPQPAVLQERPTS